MQDMPQVQDPGFVVEWQLAGDAAGDDGHRVIDLSAERPRPEIILPEDSPVRTS